VKKKNRKSNCANNKKKAHVKKNHGDNINVGDVNKKPWK